MSCPFMINMHITIPKLSKQIIWDAEPGTQVKSVIDSILKSMNIPDPELWNLFMLANDFIQIPRESVCFDIGFSNATSFQLLQLETEPIEVYYKMQKASIAYDKFKPLSSIMEICLQIFNLSDNEQYLFMNPKSYTIEAMHSPTKLTKLILKPLQFKGRELVFPTLNFVEPSGLSSFPFVSLSKTIMQFQFRILFTTLKSQFGDFSLVNFTQEELEAVFKKYELNSGIGEIPFNQQITLLFVILAQFDEPIIPSDMIDFAKSIVKNENQYKVCQQLYMFLLMLPVSSHSLISEFVICMSNSFVHSPIQSEIITILQELFFKNSNPDQEEMLFIKYILLFGPALLHLPGSRNVTRMGNKVGFQSPIDPGSFYTINEKLMNVKTEDLKLDFNFELFDSDEEINRPIELHTHISYLNASVSSFHQVMEEVKNLIQQMKQKS